MSGTNLRRKDRKRRGISPVIGTLFALPMILIGGAMTFVFAQETIQKDQVTMGTKIESVSITGYDARDTSTLVDHKGYFTKSQSAGIPNGLKEASERIAIYFKNNSVEKIWIKELRFAGTVYEFSNNVVALDTFSSNTAPAQGEYVILTKSPDILVSTGSPQVDEGKLVTIVLGLEQDFKQGRAAQIKITTTTGTVVVGTLSLGGYHEESVGLVRSITYQEEPNAPPPEEEEEEELDCYAPGVIDFETDAFGNTLVAGTIISNQWHAIDTHISVINDHPSHPDEAIIFDSNNPTGGDWDLARPWDSGNLPSNFDLGKILIIAEDIVDSNGDGLVDDPDDEAVGGAIYFQSGQSHCSFTFDLIDIDENANPGYVKIILEEGGVVERPYSSFAGFVTGDNSANRLSLTHEEIGGTFKQIEFHFDGSGALDNIILS